MALVSLALTGLIAAALLQTAVMERGVVARRERDAQARWLAEAGVQRAVARLAADASYAGEIWQVAGNAGRGAASVRIEAAAASDVARRILVRAEYPGDASQRRRANYILNIELPLTGDNP